MESVVAVDGSADEEAHKGLVRMDRKSFGEEVGQVVGASAPEDAELLLGDTITDPVEAHIAGFGTLELDAIVGNTHSASIIA